MKRLNIVFGSEADMTTQCEMEFWTFWTLRPNRSKKSKMPIQKSSIMKNGHFIIIYPAPIKNLKKNQFWKLAKIIKKAYRLGTYYILHYTLFSNLNY